MDKKLKVGDYFTDDGRTFKVEAVKCEKFQTEIGEVEHEVPVEIQD